jgi:hypothetical protein
VAHKKVTYRFGLEGVALLLAGCSGLLATGVEGATTAGLIFPTIKRGGGLSGVGIWNVPIGWVGIGEWMWGC